MMKMLRSAEFEGAVKAGACVVVVGASWCPDCVKIEPILAELESEYGARVEFFKVSFDTEVELKDTLNIRRIPTLLFYKEGAEVGERLVEPSSKSVIEEAIKGVL